MDEEHSRHNPEVLRPQFEGGENDDLNDLLRGLDELASACGGWSGTQFAVEALEQMKSKGLTINPMAMRAILHQAFGEPEELLGRMLGHTPDELDEMLPGEIGDASAEYIRPLLEGENGV